MIERLRGGSTSPAMQANCGECATERLVRGVSPACVPERSSSGRVPERRERKDDCTTCRRTALCEAIYRGASSRRGGRNNGRAKPYTHGGARAAGEEPEKLARLALERRHKLSPHLSHNTRPRRLIAMLAPSGWPKARNPTTVQTKRGRPARHWGDWLLCVCCQLALQTKSRRLR